MTHDERKALLAAITERQQERANHPLPVHVSTYWYATAGERKAAA